MENKNQLAQKVSSIEEIDNNPEPVIEITPTPITIEEMPQLTLNTIEDMTDPNPVPPINPDENVTGTSQELKPKFVPNTVRYIDSGFTF